MNLIRFIRSVRMYSPKPGAVGQCENALFKGLFLGKMGLLMTEI